MGGESVVAKLVSSRNPTRKKREERKRAAPQRRKPRKAIPRHQALGRRQRRREQRSRGAGSEGSGKRGLAPAHHPLRILASRGSYVRRNSDGSRSPRMDGLRTACGICTGAARAARRVYQLVLRHGRMPLSMPCPYSGLIDPARAKSGLNEPPRAKSGLSEPPRVSASGLSERRSS